MAAHPREIRRLALQMLYQIDARGGADLEQIRHAVLEAGHAAGDHFDERWRVTTPPDPRDHARAYAKAIGAWASREEADRRASALSPDWPTHRQPVLDRNIIRLCWHEMTTAGVPPRVAVSEAVEMGKEFGTERSAAFLNGVLDRLLREVAPESADRKPDPASPDETEKETAGGAETAAEGAGGPADARATPADDAGDGSTPAEQSGETSGPPPLEFWSSDR